jgi:hypothetical protein
MPAKNSLEDLRDHLFETLEALRDEEKPMEIDRARAVSEVASQIIESAKVEVKFLEVTGEAASSQLFMPRSKQAQLPAKTGEKK